MKTTIQIKSIFGKLLFEFEKENNTIKDTVEEAVKNGAKRRSSLLLRKPFLWFELMTKLQHTSVVT